MRAATLTLLFLAAFIAQAQEPFAYKVYKITGPVGATTFFPLNMAEDGTIVGYANVAGETRAFAGTVKDGYQVLPDLPESTKSFCFGGSATGFLAGEANDNTGKRLAVYWTPDKKIVTMGLPEGRDYASSIGATTTGEFLISAGTVGQQNAQPYVWTAINGFSARAPLPGTVTAAPNAMLEDGAAVGVSFIERATGGTEYRATLWLPDGTPLQLAHPNGVRDATAYYAKSQDLIVGFADMNSVPFATVWENRVPRVLPGLGGGSGALGISATGDIVGSSNDQAVIWRGGTTLVNLNTMIDPSTPGWVLRYANSVGPAGEVFGYGRFNGVDYTYFVAEPVFGQDVPVEAATVNLGWLEQGDHFSLEAVDNDVFRVCKFTVPNQQVAPVQVTVSGHTPYPTLGSLLLQVVSRAAQGGAFTQKLEFFDFAVGAYDPVDTRTDGLNRSWSDRTLAASGNVSRYRRSDGLIRARYSVRAVGPTAVLGWCSEHDMVKWQVRP